MKLVLAAATLAAAVSAQSAAPGPDSAAPVPQSRVVTIDAIVADARGRPVETLKGPDFEVTEDGATRSVDEVKFVRDEARLFAIYLDEYHIERGEASERIRAALTTFIDRSIGPADRVAVLKPLDSLLKIQVTGDRAAARAIVASFEGRKGDYTPHSEYERELIAGAPPRVDAQRAQVVWSALDALAVHLGTFRGRRKTLIVASEPFGIPPRHRGQELLPSLESAVRAANRWNVSIYPVIPGSSDADASTDEPLRRLAVETNGRVIDGDLDAGLKGVDADARGYYLLTYRAAHPDDGRFHGVQIRIRRMAGAEVRARKGFYDASPDEALGEAVLARLNAPKPATPPEPAPHASPLIRPWFGWSRGEQPGRTRVTFVWEPSPLVPGERVRHLPKRLVLTALTPDGHVLFEGPVDPTGAGAIDEPGATPLRAMFDVPPGRVKLRMTIQDAAAQPLDRDVRDIVVGDLPGPVAIGTPEVMRARNARELRTLSREAAVPVVSREFSRAEQLLIRVPVYAGSAGPVEVSARLLGRSGQAMRQLEAADPPPAAGFDAFTLSLGGLAIGEYTIEVIAKTATGQATNRLTFRVTS
jgi:VWFA-related protein